MIKFYVTGDNHFGLRYDRYSEIKEALKESRFECFNKMVKQAWVD